VPKPVLSLDAIRLHHAPLYQDDTVVDFETIAPPEVRGTLYLQDGGSMKLWQTLTPDEAADLEALLERAASRILASMTAALGPEEWRETITLQPENVDEPPER
jgi:hypothetical protein